MKSSSGFFCRSSNQFGRWGRATAQVKFVLPARCRLVLGWFGLSWFAGVAVACLVPRTPAWVPRCCCCLHTSPTVDRGQGRGHYSGPSSVTAVRDHPTSCLLSLNSLLYLECPCKVAEGGNCLEEVTVGPGTLTIVRDTCEWAADT